MGYFHQYCGKYFPEYNGKFPITFWEYSKKDNISEFVRKKDSGCICYLGIVVRTLGYSAGGSEFNSRVTFLFPSLVQESSQNFPGKFPEL